MKTLLPREFVAGALKILMAAFVLGVAFNNVHPLRVGGGDSPLPAPSNTVAGQPEMTAEHVDGLANRTLTLRFVTPEMAGQSATPPAGLPRLQEHAPETSAPAAKPTPGSRPLIAGNLTWAQTQQLLAARRIVLVDARSREAFAAGHIPGAVSLPADYSPDEIADFTRKYPRTMPIVVYCASPQCGLSRRLGTALAEQHGYIEVRDMPGGYTEWRLAQTPPPTNPTLAHVLK